MATGAHLDLARELAAGNRSDLAPVPVILMSTHAREELAPLVAQGPALGFIAKVELSGTAVRELLGECD